MQEVTVTLSKSEAEALANAAWRTIEPGDDYKPLDLTAVGSAVGKLAKAMWHDPDD
jgi:hypothetical protein